MFTNFDKAIAGALVTLAMPYLSMLGLSAEATFTQIVQVLVAGLVVWFVPNKK